jgi:membrane protease YdiL (CAAX protease family)
MGWLAVAYVGNFGFMDGIAYVLPHLENTLETQFQELAHNPIGAIDLVFVGPLMEELLFRVAILGLLLRRFKPWIAITVSALIFALVHWNPEQSVYALLMGSFLAWIYYRTQSIMPGLVLHVVNNGMSWLTIYTGEDKAYYTFEALGLNAVGAVLFVVGSTALLAYAIWQLYRASIGMQAHKDASASPSTVVRCCESETNVLSDQSDQ